MRCPAFCCLLLQLFFECSSVKIQVVPGSELTLPCLPFEREYDGHTVTWKHNGLDITSTRLTGDLEDERVVLMISPVKAASAGRYECVVKENTMELRNIYDIQIVESPEYALIVYQGSSIILPCKRPSFKQWHEYAVWFKETAESGKTQLTPVATSKPEERLEWLYAEAQHSDQTVTFKELVKEDTGVYHCESSTGERFSTITLTVSEAPKDAPYSCSGFNTTWPPCLDETSRSWAQMLQESIAEFSMKVYSHLRQSQSSSNLLYSPISMVGVLSHLLLGARGDTRRDIEAALYMPHDFSCVHLEMKRLRQKLNSSLQMASQIFYNPLVNLSESFTNQSVHFYEAKPFRLLSNSSDNAQSINSWVAEKTHNKITHLVDSVPDETQLILLNAVSFSGQWKVKFSMKPKKAEFTKLNGDIIKVPVLYSDKYTLSTEYIPEIKAKVARFLLTGESSLYILLPRSHTLAYLQAVEDSLTDEAMRVMVKKMMAAHKEVQEVMLPKIHLDIETNMNKLLTKLGLASLFEGANLCGLFPEDKLLLNDARHKAVLKLTEDGVEAGAVTSLSFARTHSAFSAMQPFILLLWSDQADIPLFVGRVTEPEVI